jgi:hypothetical protein
MVYKIGEMNKLCVFHEEMSQHFSMPNIACPRRRDENGMKNFTSPEKQVYRVPSAVSAVETTITFLLGNVVLLICVGFAQIRRVFLFRNFVFVFHTQR